MYSYDLDLGDFYAKCGQNYMDWLNLQVQDCADTLIPSDASASLPHLPYFCHTPYYPDTTSDFIGGQHPARYTNQ